MKEGTNIRQEGSVEIPISEAIPIPASTLIPIGQQNNTWSGSIPDDFPGQKKNKAKTKYSQSRSTTSNQLVQVEYTAYSDFTFTDVFKHNLDLHNKVPADMDTLDETARLEKQELKADSEANPDFDPEQTLRLNATSSDAFNEFLLNYESDYSADEDCDSMVDFVNEPLHETRKPALCFSQAMSTKVQSMDDEKLGNTFVNNNESSDEYSLELTQIVNSKSKNRK